MKRLCLLFLLVFSGCSQQSEQVVAEFNDSDLANKVVVLLKQYKIKATLSQNKEVYSVYVNNDAEMKARKLLTKFNFYFHDADLNELLESKFASLSKLETVKGNLLESREIYNKISIIPNILRSTVIVTGDKKKYISVLIISLATIKQENKKNIEHFLKGLITDNDELTVSYFVQNASNENI